MMKILTVVGNRPQFIKSASVSAAFDRLAGVQEILLLTGQHFDTNMSEVFFSELAIRRPKYNLGVRGSSHGSMTGAQLIEIEKIMLTEKPDRVITYGDTNSTLAGTLAGVKLNIHVSHVESGLRSFNKRMPEEVNRIVADHLSDLLFVPTSTALANLRREGIPEMKCQVVGDVMFDAALLFAERAASKSNILTDLGIVGRQYVLLTIHRAENTDDRSQLLLILRSVERINKSLPVVWPLHPRTRDRIREHGLETVLDDNIRVIDPVGYLDMIMLEQNASVIVTDSGGVQKEAFFHKVPCVTLRPETEWKELIDSNWNQLVSPEDPFVVERAVLESIGKTGKPINPYGDGKAGERIVKAILEDEPIDRCHP